MEDFMHLFTSPNVSNICILITIFYLGVFTAMFKTPLIYIREINDYSIQIFIELLSYETWDTIFSNDNTNEIFNSFLGIYLKIFQTSFSLKKKTALLNFKPWLTQGIKNSCTNKKKLYEKLKNSEDSSFKLYYSKYCKILKSTIETSKRMYYDKLVSKSTKITWNIIKETINKMNSQNKMTSMKINNKLINDPDVIANSFNSYFTLVAHKFIQKPMDNNFNQDPVYNLSSKFLNLNTILHFNPPQRIK